MRLPSLLQIVYLMFKMITATMHMADGDGRHPRLQSHQTVQLQGWLGREHSFGFPGQNLVLEECMCCLSPCSL